MPKGFTFQWNPTKLSDNRAAFAKTILENFRQLESFINGYVPTYEAATSSLVLPHDLDVSGDLSVAGAHVHAGGKQHIHVYDSVGSQAIPATTWTTINLDTESGASAADIFTHDTVNDEVDLLTAGVYMAIGQATFQASETGFFRLMLDGVSEVARARFSTATTDQVVGLFAISTPKTLNFQVYSDTAAALTASPGSQATYLQVAKIEGLL